MRFADGDDVVNAVTVNIGICHIDCTGHEIRLPEKMFLPEQPTGKATRVVGIQVARFSRRQLQLQATKVQWLLSVEHKRRVRETPGIVRINHEVGRYARNDCQSHPGAVE